MEEGLTNLRPPSGKYQQEGPAAAVQLRLCSQRYVRRTWWEIVWGLEEGKGSDVIWFSFLEVCSGEEFINNYSYCDVNFLCQFDYAIICPDISLNIILSVSLGVCRDEINIWIGGLGKSSLIRKSLVQSTEDMNATEGLS